MRHPLKNGGGVFVSFFLAASLLVGTFLVPSTASAQGAFQRGDSNADRTVDISDASYTLGFLFLGSSTPPCLEAADANDDGTVDISDASYTLGFLFLGTKEPPAPGPFTPGLDPTTDPLGCGPAEEQTDYEPPDEPPASPETSRRGEVAVRGWDPQQKKEIVGTARLALEVLAIPGRGLDFAWVCTYRSRGGRSTPIGSGWDFSYDIRIERRADGVELFDGTGRHDLFRKRADGTYAATAFFIVGNDAPDLSVSFTFPDGGTWQFNPLDSSVKAGKVSRIADRNGNALRFEYDPLGRLVTVHDTLDHDIRIVYNADSRIDSVIDHTGRQARFVYYRDGDADGASGDLKSVTTPAVTGTPNGDDFPDGKTSVYTYSKGFADERLNHNLLTITDPKGQTFLRDEYSPATDPSDPSFDRIIHRDLAARNIKTTYSGGGAGGAGGFKAIVNDRAGNVREYSYDSQNRLVLLRYFTGRANPDLPTTEMENRPTNKLRASDPDYYGTRFGWNGDSCLAARDNFLRGAADAEMLSFLHCVYESDIDPTALPRSRGNLREVHRLPGSYGGDQPKIVESYEYDAAPNRVTRAVDGRGNEMRYEYDARGNRVRTIHEIPSIIDDFEYNGLGQLTAHVWPDNGSGHRRRDEAVYGSPTDGGPQTAGSGPGPSTRRARHSRPASTTTPWASSRASPIRVGTRPSMQSTSSTRSCASPRRPSLLE